MVNPWYRILFDEYNEGVMRARLEYQMHPRSGRGEHSSHCASMGCPDGVAVSGNASR